MPFLSILLIGVAMSSDAFAAAIGKGAVLRKARLHDAVFIGCIFGVIEAITPMIGWLLGHAAQQFVQQIDHWIAFGLLSALGTHMIYTSIHPTGAMTCVSRQLPLAVDHTVSKLIMAGLATSIDAMAIGVTFAFLNANIILVSFVIGLCTFIAVTVGVLLGSAFGNLFGRYTGILGGVILIAIGSMILFQHTHAMA